MSEITRVGVDLAKSVIQVHAVDAPGRLVTNRQLSRDKFLTWCAQLPVGCVVAMEGCAGAHHWARKLIALGLMQRSSRHIWWHPIGCRAKVARMTPMMRLPFVKRRPGRTCTLYRSKPPFSKAFYAYTGCAKV